MAIYGSQDPKYSSITFFLLTAHQVRFFDDFCGEKVKPKALTAIFIVLRNTSTVFNIMENNCMGLDRAFKSKVRKSEIFHGNFQM